MLPNEDHAREAAEKLYESRVDLGKVSFVDHATPYFQRACDEYAAVWEKRAMDALQGCADAEAEIERLKRVVEVARHATATMTPGIRREALRDAIDALDKETP